MKKIFLLFGLGLFCSVLLSCDLFGDSSSPNNKTDDVFTPNTGYSIGQKGPAGGWIFYDCDADNYSGNKDGLKSSECNWRYLEAAPEDLSTGYPWGDDGTFGTKEGIGEGKNNTQIILQSSTVRPDNAAKACDSYSINYGINNYDDWFLPSKGELQLMFDNIYNNWSLRASYGPPQRIPGDHLGKCGWFNFNHYYYWSSSESSNGQAYMFGLAEEVLAGVYRYGTWSVRPCRAFL